MPLPSTAVHSPIAPGLRNRAGRPLSVGLLLGLLFGGASLAMAQETLPDGPGKEAITSSCTVCHGVSLITVARRSRAGWEETVNDMVARGAPLLEGEREVVIEYLAKHLGVESSKVNINRVSAKELAASFGLPVKDAEAIVQFREQKGNYRNWEDLKKVPGIDLQKIEAKQDRLSF